MLLTVSIYTVVAISIVMVIWYPMLFILHAILPPKLNPVLFREPYFKRAELFNYQFFPLSFLRTLSFIMMVAFPKLGKWRRFKGFEGEVSVGPVLRLVCQVHMVLGFVGMILVVPLFSLVGYVLLFV